MIFSVFFRAELARNSETNGIQMDFTQQYTWWIDRYAGQRLALLFKIAVVAKVLGNDHGIIIVHLSQGMLAGELGKFWFHVS